MLCPKCSNESRKFGKDRNGNQRYQCQPCKLTFSDRPEKPLGEMRLPIEKAVQCIKLLMEGCSVRSTERVTGVNRDTICGLILTAGEKVQSLLDKRIVNMQVKDVEMDEIWGFVQMKEKTRIRRHPENSRGRGDCWCYIAFESNTKLVLTWHVAKRNPEGTEEFLSKLRTKVQDGFQLSSDAYKDYSQRVYRTFRFSVNYGQIIKTYGRGAEEDNRRYSPPTILSIDKKVIIGEPDEGRICTSYIERNNLSIRTFVRRMTRLTNGFSKKWENHEAALALYFAYFNFCWKHSTLKTTPAVASGLTDHQWTVEELLTHQ